MAKGKKSGGGSRKGQPNKTTAKARELILVAIDSQSEHFNTTMAELRADEPKEWAKIMVKLMDFVLPKKVDITSDGESFIAPQIVLKK